MWAVLIALFTILVAATSAQAQATETGGAASPESQPDTEYARVNLGERPLRMGVRGDDVKTLQSILQAKRFGPTLVDGKFDSDTNKAVERFQKAVKLEADGLVGQETARALVRRMQLRRTTWYGPGLYGNKTACGKRLRKSTVGVAHRSLPCGTRVTFAHGGRFLTTRVIDRGPFRKGYSWDLTEAAANKLGFQGASKIRSLHYKPGQARIARDGRTAIAPPDAPVRVRRAIKAANSITRKPYRYGGGHASFKSSGYDCSGAISYALKGAGILKRPLDSTRYMRWGKRGRGRWITVYANRGHAYVKIAGLRFDTSGRGAKGPRWRSEARSSRGFRARHYRGL